MKIYKTDLIPLKILILYILIGVSLSFWGPVLYSKYDKLPVAVYMISFLILFSIGYLWGLVEYSNPKTIIENTQKYQNFYQVLFWVKVSIAIIALVQFINLTSSLLDGTLNLSVSKMGEAYVNTYKDYERGQGHLRLSFLIQTFTYIPYLVTLILGAFYFKNLSRFYKLLVIFSYLSIILLETIGHGKQKQLGDMFIFLLIVFVLKSNLHDPIARKRLFRKVVLFGVAGISSLVTVLYFRYSALNIDASNINEKAHPLMQYNLDSIVFKLFGNSIGFPLSAFSSYLSQGYYGLSLCMKEPFEWTYFMGNSYSLTVFMNRFLGVPVDFHDTYPYRTSLDSEWDDTKWSTVFTWFAGDLTFVGTLFFFSLVAFLYAKVWRESYLYHNPISIILFANLTMGLLYIPANNQLLHTPGSILAILFFLVLWSLKHKKFNFDTTQF